MVTHAAFYRPFHDSGASVDAVHGQLAARATRLGWRLEGQGSGDLHLMVDGVCIDPYVRALAARFTVPVGTDAVWLVSGSTIPAEIDARSPDRRTLGVCIAALTFDDGFGAPRGVALDDACLCVGFHSVEQVRDATLRCTAGRARLPASSWEGSEGDTFLRVDLARSALPRWVAPMQVNDRATACLKVDAEIVS